MAYDAALAANTQTLRRYVRSGSPYGEYAAQFYIVSDLKGNAEHLSDAELGARVRMLLAALEAAKAPAELLPETCKDCESAGFLHPLAETEEQVAEAEAGQERWINSHPDA